MNLFEMNNGVLRIQPEAYALIPFKLLWDRDKSKDKNTALSELAYVYYMADYTSDFADIVDLEDRDKEVRKNCIRLTNWNPDKYVIEAVEFYRSRQETVASKMLEGALIYADKMDKWFRKVNLFEEDDNGKPKYDVKKGNDMLKDLGKTVESLKQLQETVRKEVEIKDSLRGNRKKGMYAD